MYAIGQTVETKRSETLQKAKGHVIFANDDEVHVRTSSMTLICKPSWLTILSEEALPLEAAPIPRDNQTAQIVTAIVGSQVPLSTTPTPGSKKEQALNIYRVLRATDGFSRKSCIKAFQETLGMSEAGASTYFNTCKQTLTN